MIKTTSLAFIQWHALIGQGLAVNMFSNKAMEREDQTGAGKCSSSRTHMNFQKIDEHQISTKIYKLYITRTVSTCTSWICNWFALTLTVATGSNDLSLHIKTSKHDFSHYTQPNHKPQASCWPTLNDLQNAYHDSHNRGIRKNHLVVKQWWILEFPRAKAKNRWWLWIRKLNERSSSAQGCSNCKNDENSIDEQALNSRDSWRFWRGFAGTDHQYHM